ncbi:MAG TPA: hypothetical protein PLV25_01985, partial [Opitutales bacterium]|nr:hypothetical protein [Opitutales bacterium]
PIAPHARLVDTPQGEDFYEHGPITFECDLALARFRIEDTGRFAWPIGLRFIDEDLGLCVGTYLPYWAQLAGEPVVGLGAHPLQLLVGHAEGLSSALEVIKLELVPYFYA